MTEAVAAAPVICTNGIEMVFGRQHVLANVGLEIRSGEVVSIVGPSGCGKSTLLRLLAGLIDPTSGEVTLAGHAPAAARRTHCRLAFVFQDPTLLPWRTVYDNVRLPLQLEETPRDEQDALVRDTVALVGLAESDLRKRPQMLSGGMRMRVSLARALVTQPDVLLLDEPFAALDDLLRHQLNEELLRITGRRGCTTVFVTHNVSEAVFLSQRVLVMSSNPGTIAAEVPINFNQPRDAELRASSTFASLTGDVSRKLRKADA